MQKAAKVLVFLACLTPFVWLAIRTLTGRLGINPVEDLELTTGIWSLRFLIVTLAVTPVRRLTGWNRVIQYRRMFGLFTFFYVCVPLCHLHWHRSVLCLRLHPEGCREAARSSRWASPPLS